MFLLSLFTFLTFQEPIELITVSQTELETPSFEVADFITDPKGNFYTVHNSDSRVYKFNSNGRLLQEIASPGKGPGEVIQPKKIFLMEQNRKLIVVTSRGKWHAFEAATGKFLGHPFKYLPGLGWTKWDDQHILGFFPASDHFFVKVKATGEVVKSWGEKPKLIKGIFWTRYFANTITSDKRVLYQEGTFPEVLVYKRESDDHLVKKLKPPKHYLEPPSEPYNFNRYGFNRKKWRAYHRSYTQLHRLAILAENYLVVLWNIHEPYKHCFAVYDMKTWKPVVQDFISPGYVIHTSKDLLYVVEERDTEIDDKVLVHTYRLSVKSSP